MASTETANQKQCRIKTGVVQRLQKELQSYHTDLEKQRAKVARMREEAADEYDIKKQVEVQGETEVMIPDTMRRLERAVDELHEFVTVHGAELEGSAQLEAARALLAEARPEGAPAGADEDERI